MAVIVDQDRAVDRASIRSVVARGCLPRGGWRGRGARD